MSSFKIHSFDSISQPFKRDVLCKVWHLFLKFVRGLSCLKLALSSHNLIFMTSLCGFVVQVCLFIPVTFVLSCVFMIVVSFWAAPFECLIGSGIILTGIPAYLLGYKWKKPREVKKMLGEWAGLMWFQAFGVFSQSAPGRVLYSLLWNCDDIVVMISALNQLWALIRSLCLCDRCQRSQTKAVVQLLTLWSLKSQCFVFWQNLWRIFPALFRFFHCFSFF